MHEVRDVQSVRMHSHLGRSRSTTMGARLGEDGWMVPKVRGARNSATRTYLMKCER